MDDEYLALIGAAPTDTAKQKAIAKQLRRRRAFGELGAITGDRVLQPFGENQMAQADDYAKQIQDTRQRDADNAQTKSYQDAQIGHMGKVLSETVRANQESERLKGDEIAASLITRGKVSEAEKARVKAHQKRFEALGSDTAARRMNLTKATDFLAAFSPEGLPEGNSLGLPTGFKAKSGAGRRALFAGGYAPVFSEQGQFDEQIESFAETAARSRLKALGEIRPTDADVLGMKRSLFGNGRDELTNKQLLEQYLEEQGDLEKEFTDLRNEFEEYSAEDEAEAAEEDLTPTEKAIRDLQLKINGMQGQPDGG